jgi:F-type H+-transporting ATPase subunit c
LRKLREKDSAGESFCFGPTDDCQREGASLVSLNHPLAINFVKQEKYMRKVQYLLMALSVLCFAVPAMAQSATGVIDLAPIGAGIGIAIAAGLCGLGQGKATGSAVEALARNPGARAGIQLLLVLGLAFIESLTLFTLVIIFAKIK